MSEPFDRGITRQKEGENKHFLKMLGTAAQKKAAIETTKEIIGHVLTEINGSQINQAMHGNVFESFWKSIETLLPDSKHLPIGYVGKVLEGFKLSDKPLHQKKVFKPPDLPRHFKPVHVFKKPKDTDFDPKQSQQSAITRSLALGEVGSVFDLVSTKDKQNMERARKGTDQSVVQSSPQSSEPASDGRPGTSFQANREPSSSHLQLVPRQTSTTSTGPDAPSSASLVQTGSLTFKPFAKDERKQARYEKYLSLVKQGNKDAYDEVTEGHMTEWEREHEKEEFIKAAKMYKPLPGMIASRFTRAKFDDQDDTVDVPAEDGVNKDDRVKAAEMKMYGKLTRDVFEWHPDRLLCRRFNVQDPYPHSSIIGLPTVKRDKFSVYNFLTFPSTEASTENEPSTEISESLKASDSSGSIKDQRETAKSHDKPVSIFSHLGKPNTEKSKSVSFSLTKPKSIFSHLVEDKKDKSPNKISSTPSDGGARIKEEQIVEEVNKASTSSSQISSWSVENDIYTRETLDTLQRRCEGKISPIAYQVRKDVDKLAPSTLRQLKRKAATVVEETLDLLAPNQAKKVCRLIDQEMRPEPPKIDSLIIELYRETNAKNSKTQFLSMIAHNYSKEQLKDLLPGVTTYTIDKARKHAKEDGKEENNCCGRANNKASGKVQKTI